MLHVIPLSPSDMSRLPGFVERGLVEKFKGLYEGPAGVFGPDTTL